MNEHLNDITHGAAAGAELPPGRDVSNIDAAVDALDQLRDLAESETPESKLRAQLYRRGEKRNWVYCAVYESVAEFDLEELRRTKGSGDYQLRIKGNTADLKARGIPQTYTFSVEGDESAPAATAVPETDTQRRIRELERRLEQQTGTPAPQFIPQPVSTAQDLTNAVLQQLQGVFAIVTPLIAPLLAARQQPEGGASVKEMFDVFEKGLRVGRGERNRDRDREPPRSSMVELAIEKLSEPLGRAIDAHIGNTINPPSQPAPAVTAGAPPVPVNPLEPLRPFVGLIVNVSETNMEPISAIEMLEKMRPDLAEWLAGMIEMNGEAPLIEGICNTYPELQPQREWLTRFVSEFLEEEEPPS